MKADGKGFCLLFTRYSIVFLLLWCYCCCHLHKSTEPCFKIRKTLLWRSPPDTIQYSGAACDMPHQLFQKKKWREQISLMGPSSVHYSIQWPRLFIRNENRRANCSHLFALTHSFPFHVHPALFALNVSQFEKNLVVLVGFAFVARVSFAASRFALCDSFVVAVVDCFAPLYSTNATWNEARDK